MTAVDERRQRIAEVGYDLSGLAVEHVRECNLCGSRRHVEVSRVDRYGYPAVLRVCSRCGLGFLSPRLSAEEYAVFYSDVYRPLVSAYHGRRIDAETVQRDQRGYAAELVEFLRGTLADPPKTVLDVGGSTGVVAGAIVAAFGADATVLDPSPDELAVAAGSGMQTVAGFAEDVSIDATFDLVLLCQTIDHLLDVTSTLRAMRQWLAAGGHAFVDVLDVEFVARRQSAIEQAVKIDHPYYLTRATAVAYFTKTGLEVVAERMSDDGHWGFLLAPAEPAEPDWRRVRREGGSLLRKVWALRALR